MQKELESFRNTWLVLAANGDTVAVLKQPEGVSDEDLDTFRLSHCPNGVELKNFAEYIADYLELPEIKTRLGELTKKRRRKGFLGFQFIDEQDFTEHDATIKVINELLHRFVGIKEKYTVQPRTPLPKESDGERGRRLAAQAQAAEKAATAYPPKVEALLEKRRKIDAEIDAILEAERLAKLREEEAKRKVAEKAAAKANQKPGRG